MSEQQRRAPAIAVLEPYKRYDDTAGAPVNHGWFKLTRPAAGGRTSLTLTAQELVTFSYSNGRERAGEDFETPTLTFSYVPRFNADPRLNPAAVDFTSLLRVGDALRMDLTTEARDWLDANAVPRSANDYMLHWGLWVTDAKLEHQQHYLADVDDYVHLPVLTVTCTGKLGRLGSAYVTTQDIIDNDSVLGVLFEGKFHARLQDLGSILRRTNTGTAWDRVDPNGVVFFTWGDWSPVDTLPVLVQRDVDHNDATTLLREAGEAGGYLFEQQGAGGRVTFYTLEQRRGRQPLVTLDADQLQAGITWEAGSGSLVNRFTITYGYPDAEGTRPQLTVADEESIDRYGEHSQSVDSQLKDEADALDWATLMVGRGGRPRYAISQLTIDLLRQVDAGTAGRLLTAPLGSLLELTELPPSAPALRFYFVEGKQIRQTRTTLELTLSVSEAGRTGAPIRWEDVDTELTWADAATDDAGEPLTWLAAAGWFDQPSAAGAPAATDTWLDVPSSVKWWDLAPGETRSPFDTDTRGPSWASWPDNP